MISRILSVTAVLILPLTVFAEKQIDNEIEQNSDAFSTGDFSEVLNLLKDYDAKVSQSHPISDVQPDDIPLAVTLMRDDGTELYPNREIATDLFENDVVLTLDQAKRLVRYHDRRHKRKVITGAQYRWDSRTIPYKLAENDESWQSRVLEGIGFWQANTCLRFKRNGRGRDHIVFIKGSGCYSSVGRTGGRQHISIGRGCGSMGIVAHEIGHSLGFWHEQSRPDRDNFVKVAWKYILSGTKGNFQKRAVGGIHYYDQPYDLGSVMHYGPRSFSTQNDKATLVPLNGAYSNTIGQRIRPSFIDVKQVNEMYCSGTCLSSSLICRHGGYADPRNCQRCKCPSGLGGIRCERVASSASNCGGELTASADWKTLKWSDVAENQNCIWRITTSGSGSTAIELKVVHVELPCFDTCSNFVELKHSDDLRLTGPRFCCKTPSQTEFRSSVGEALIIYRTTERGSNFYSGFEIRFRRLGGSPDVQPPAVRRPELVGPSGGAEGVWATWSQWSECSVSCGGCGLRTRQRVCQRGQCDPMRRRQRDGCGEKACPLSLVGITGEGAGGSSPPRSCQEAKNAFARRFCRWRARRLRQSGIRSDAVVTPEEMTAFDDYLLDDDATLADDITLADDSELVQEARLRNQQRCCDGYRLGAGICEKQ